MDMVIHFVVMAVSLIVLSAVYPVLSRLGYYIFKKSMFVSRYEDEWEQRKVRKKDEE